MLEAGRGRRRRRMQLLHTRRATLVFRLARRQWIAMWEAIVGLRVVVRHVCSDWSSTRLFTTVALAVRTLGSKDRVSRGARGSGDTIAGLIALNEARCEDSGWLSRDGLVFSGGRTMFKFTHGANAGC